MAYRLPTLEDRDVLKDYLNECRDNDEQNVLLHQELFEKDFPAWVERIGRNSREGNGEWGRSLLLLCFDGDEVVGILCIRYELSRELEAVYGNIGYEVRASKRGRGYATQMPQYALNVCSGFCLESVTLGCCKDNAASAAVMKKRGGGDGDRRRQEALRVRREHRVHESACGGRAG